jgi:hypothetical protein
LWSASVSIFSCTLCVEGAHFPGHKSMDLPPFVCVSACLRPLVILGLCLSFPRHPGSLEISEWHSGNETWGGERYVVCECVRVFVSVFMATNRQLTSVT